MFTAENVSCNQRHWLETKVYSIRPIGSRIQHSWDRSNARASSVSSSIGSCVWDPCAMSSPTCLWHQTKSSWCDPIACPETLPSIFWGCLWQSCEWTAVSMAFIYIYAKRLYLLRFVNRLRGNVLAETTSIGISADMGSVDKGAKNNGYYTDVHCH